MRIKLIVKNFELVERDLTGMRNPTDIAKPQQFLAKVDEVVRQPRS